MPILEFKYAVFISPSPPEAKERDTRRKENLRKSMARPHRIPQNIPRQPPIKMMKRQIKQPTNPPTIPLLPPAHHRPTVPSIHALLLKTQSAPSGTPPPPAVHVGVYVRHDEADVLLAASAEPVVDDAFDGGRGPAAAGAEVDVGVGVVGGEVALEDVRGVGGRGGGEREGRQCPDEREGVLDVGAEEGGEPSFRLAFGRVGGR